MTGGITGRRAGQGARRPDRRARLARVAAVALLAASPACDGCGGCGGQGSTEPSYDAAPIRRVLEPPPGEVRALPPHAILADGVGPYVLGTSLEATLDLLPHGPRVVLMEIDGVTDYSLVRTEGSSLIIGVDPPYGVAFLAVLDAEVGKTETQVGVGSSESELLAAMGPVLARPGVVLDPHILVFERLPTVRFVLDRMPDVPQGSSAGSNAESKAGSAASSERRVVAVVVVRGGDASWQANAASPASSPSPASPAAPGPPTASEPAPPAGAAPPTAQKSGGAIAGAANPPVPAVATLPQCDATTTLSPLARQIRQVARLDSDADTFALASSALRPVYGCFSGAQPEALVVAGSRLALIAGKRADPARLLGRPVESVRLERLAVYQSTTAIDFAAAIDLDDDGHHEIALVTDHRSATERVIGLEILRVDAGRLNRIASGELYRVSQASAAWIGARLDDIALYLELDARGERVDVTGIYLQQGRSGLHTVTPLLPRSLSVRRRRLLGASTLSAASGDDDPLIIFPASDEPEEPVDASVEPDAGL